MNFKINTITLVLLLSSCSNHITINYQIKPDTTYHLTKSTVLGINETLTEVNSEFEIKVGDMENILISTIKSETKSNSEEVERLTEVIKNNYSQTDSTWINPNNCRSIDSKSLISNNSINVKTDVTTSEAIIAWNTQLEMPNIKLSINDSTTITTKHSGYTTARRFKIDSITNRIVFLSYQEELSHDNEALNIRLNNTVKTARFGKAEYDLNNEHFRLIYSKTIGNYGKENSQTEENIQTKPSQNMKILNETTIKITQHNNI